MEPLIGEIMTVGFNFAPRGWTLCNGQLLPISSHSALFSSLGTRYGGDGRTTFALPDLRGRFAMHAGTGPGLSTRRQGVWGGQETVTLNLNELPNHTHAATMRGSSEPATSNVAAGARLARSAEEIYGDAAATGVRLAPEAVTVASAGAQRAHENMSPFLCVYYCIALQGVYPSRQ